MGVAREDFAKRAHRVRKALSVRGDYRMVSEKEFILRNSLQEEVFLLHTLEGDRYRMALERLNEDFLSALEQREGITQEQEVK